MKKVHVQYGSDTRTVTVPANATVATIIHEPTTRSYLGYGDNVKALVHGVEVGLDSIPNDGTTISLETKANQKARRSLTVAFSVTLA